MIEAIGIAIAATIVFGAWAFLAWATHKHASDEEKIARVQREYQKAARKIFEAKHGRREAE